MAWKFSQYIVWSWRGHWGRKPSKPPRREVAFSYNTATGNMTAVITIICVLSTTIFSLLFIAINVKSKRAHRLYLILLCLGLVIVSYSIGNIIQSFINSVSICKKICSVILVRDQDHQMVLMLQNTYKLDYLTTKLITST